LYPHAQTFKVLAMHNRTVKESGVMTRAVCGYHGPWGFEFFCFEMLT